LSNPENENLKIKLEKFTQEKKEDSVKVIEKVLNDKVNTLYEKTPHYTFSKEQVETYKTLGGTPHLDGSYTVFGEVTEGLEVIDKIAELETDEANRPRKDVRMKISLIKN
jgi:2-oxoglutarate dehydrogenase complex dehydrogenase (E1) component-like enzyme